MKRRQDSIRKAALKVSGLTQEVSKFHSGRSVWSERVLSRQ